jgi:hypothetical protein
LNRILLNENFGGRAKYARLFFVPDSFEISANSALAWLPD